MSWNEPSGGNQDKDPWGKGKNDAGPPDLDEVFKKIQGSLGGILSGGRPKRSGDEPSIPPGVILAGIFILFLWLMFDALYMVDQQERGIVLRFGKYVQTLGPGLSIRFPRPVERVYKVNVGQVRSISHKATMLTQDENIVDVEVAVQWRIRTPEDYLFNVYNPAATLRQVTESAVREVIGKSRLDFVLTEGRSEIAHRQKDLVQDTLDDYESGILVVSVEMQPAKPPEEVKAAFDDAIKAREDEQRLVNEAEAYQNEVIPRARGSAARLIEESNAYKAKVVAKAEGEASRFEQLLVEYQRSPEVTRERLYLDALEEVFKNTNKVLLNTEGSNSLMYLPIDQLIRQRNTSASLSSSIPEEFKPNSRTDNSTVDGVFQRVREHVDKRNREVR